MTRNVKMQFVRSALPFAFACWLGVPSLGAQEIPEIDCRSLIGPRTTVGGTSVGPQDCRIVEASVRNAHGALFRRMEVGISGTIEGYAPRSGTRSEMFSDAPEFAAQRGNLGPFHHGIGYYHAARGAGMTVFLPESAEDWNGKLYILAHGAGSYSSLGELPPRGPDEYVLGAGANSYTAPMIDQGFAVAYTRRPAAGAVRPSGPGVDEQEGEEVRLDDGTVLRDKTFGYHIGLLRDWTILAENLVKSRLGRLPEQTYWYGKSAGASLGRMMNYKPGANRGPDGNRLLDGMLINDAGGGWYLPSVRFRRVDMSPGVFRLEPQERDELVVDDAYRRNFAYQIDIAHQAYTGADHVVGEYLYVKRENARLLKEKGLAFKNRLYEIAGVSHSDSGGDEQLDMSGLFDALLMALDRWAVEGVEPSPTRSDAPFLGDADGNGGVENPAVLLPEMGCPTGLYIEYSQERPQPGSTVFVSYLDQERPKINADVMELPAGFDPEWLEPLDRRGYLVDMNHNGVRDTRETVEQAWQRRWRDGERYGTLEPGEGLTHEKYVQCVTRVASDLVKENLMNEKGLNYYTALAKASEVGKGVEGRMSSRD